MCDLRWEGLTDMNSQCRMFLYSAIGGLLIVGTAHAQSTESVSAAAEATDSTVQSPTSSNTAAATTEAAAAAGAALQEVVVTARKREESVLSVPTSITAFTSASLDALNINTTTDYAAADAELSVFPTATRVWRSGGDTLTGYPRHFWGRHDRRLY